MNIGPGSFYVAPMGSVFIAPLPPRRWSWAWLRSKVRRRRLSPRWVDIGYTEEGAP